MANIQEYRKSHWKMDFYFGKKSTPLKKARLKRALKKKAQRELIRDLER